MNRIQNIEQLTVGVILTRHYLVKGKPRSQMCEVVASPHIDPNTGHMVMEVVPIEESERGQHTTINLLTYGIVSSTSTGLNLSTNRTYWLDCLNDSQTSKIEEKTHA